ncbi:MAG: HAD family hydrolase [Actinobacteria bacterium]|nr:HAD family hydrolase [Actinomycetota bacterium]MCG2799879.1 HAD family hydrolase [Cellulomonas sp.]
MNDSGRIVLFDFDGTVATGPGPVLAYARAAAAALPEQVGARLVRRVEADWERKAPVEGVVPLDGYDLVRILATREGVDAATLEAAYLTSRGLLAGPLAPVDAPAGLAQLLRELRTLATVVLATNAPDIRLEAALDHLGLTDGFDQVIPSAAKPGMVPALLDRVQAQHTGATRVLSVGDVWINDLAPVHARGHATALVGEVPPGAEPTFHARDLPSLYPSIASWARSA